MSPSQPSQLGGEDSRMTDKPDSAPLQQPWKAHWPPQKAHEGQLIAFGFRKGERITIDGNSAGATGRASVPLGDPAPTGKK